MLLPLPFARRSLLFVPLVVPLAMVAAIVWLILWRTPHVPVMDEWVMVGVLQEADAGTLDFDDFWQPHNTEQRTAASRAISLAIIELTGWNRQAHMIVNLLLTGLGAGLMLRAASWTVGSRALTVALAVPMFALGFALTRFANWFLPFTDKIPTILGVAICVWALAAPRCGTRRLVIAALGALLASLSSSGGLLVWVAFAPAILLVNWQAFIGWTAAAIAFVTAYVTNFHPSTLDRAREQTGSILMPLPDAVGFVVSYLGAPIGYPDVSSSQLYGALGIVALAVTLAVLVRTGFSDPAEMRRVAVWVGLAGFAVLTAGAVMLGRGVVYGIESSITSRFIGFSSLLWIALAVLAAKTLSRVRDRGPIDGRIALMVARRSVVVPAAILLTLVAGFLRANAVAYDHATGYLAPLKEHEGCIVAFDRAPDECLRFFTWEIKEVSHVREQSAYLAQHRLAIFGSALPVTTPAEAPRIAANGNQTYQCNRIGSGSKRDPALAFAERASIAMISDLCADVLAMDHAVGALTELEKSFQGTCSVVNWNVFGERRVYDDQQWCLVDWFRDDDLAALSLVNGDGSVAIHAYADGRLSGTLWTN